MAITYRTEVLPGYPQAVGAKYETVARLILSGTYNTDGFLIEAAPFGLQYIEFVSVSVEVNSWQEFGNWQPDFGVPFPWGHWIILQNVSDGAEVTNGQDLTGDIYIVRVLGF